MCGNNAGLLIAALFLFAVSAPAAIQKTSPALVKTSEKADYSELANLAFDTTQNLETRWRAVTTAGREYPQKAKYLLEKAMKSPAWFMRNAALIVVPYGQRQWARTWAEKLLDDPALVVRTAAVQAIRQMHATESRAVLWQKLNRRENFHKGQPLWVRRHIMEALEQFSVASDIDAFREAATDQDPAVRVVAARALKKLAPQTAVSKIQ